MVAVSPARLVAVVGLLFACVPAAGASDRASQCFGTVANGRLEGGVQLPEAGDNFEAYSALGATVGRTYVHSTVRDIVLASYAALQRQGVQQRYVYGETGWRVGGRLRPHRTHQNGLSVDFMVPVRDSRGRATTLPRSVGNRYGYDLEFDDRGRLGDLSIDFDALARHLIALERAARANGSALALVIIDRKYLDALYVTASGKALKRLNLPWMKGTPWVRHDEHYHVDFSVRCKPLASG